MMRSNTANVNGGNQFLSVNQQPNNGFNRTQTQNGNKSASKKLSLGIGTSATKSQQSNPFNAFNMGQPQNNPVTQFPNTSG